jgi:hypothetical protein
MAPKGIKSSLAIVSEFGVMNAGTFTAVEPPDQRPLNQ